MRNGAGASQIPLIAADVFELAGEFRRRGELLAARAGHTQARWQLLSAASGAGEPRTVAQLARRLGVARQGVQRLAHALVREGAAEFRPNPDHHGSPHLVATARGRQALAQISSLAARDHRRLAIELSSAEAAALRAGLRRLLAALSHLPGVNTP